MGCGHICMDEVMMVVGIIAGVRLIPTWVRMMWARRHLKPNCTHRHEHEEREI